MKSSSQGRRRRRFDGDDGGDKSIYRGLTIGVNCLREFDEESCETTSRSTTPNASRLTTPSNSPTKTRESAPHLFGERNLAFHLSHDVWSPEMAFEEIPDPSVVIQQEAEGCYAATTDMLRLGGIDYASNVGVDDPVAITNPSRARRDKWFCVPDQLVTSPEDDSLHSNAPLAKIISGEWCVIEEAECDARSVLFMNKPNPVSEKVKNSKLPSREAHGTQLYLSTFNLSATSWDIVLAYSIKEATTMNRILIGSVEGANDTLTLDVRNDGWLVSKRIADCKWVSQDIILVAYGATLALFDKSSCGSLESKRPAFKAFEPSTFFNFSDEEAGKSVREVEIIPGSNDVLVSSQSSRLSRLSIGQSQIIVDGSHKFGLDGVSSARALPGLPDLASCTLDSGRLFGFDARMRWEPVSSFILPCPECDTTLVAHDWLDENIMVCGSFNNTGSFLTYVDHRKTGSILFRKHLETLPYDIRTRNGNCLISGEPTFTFIPRGSVDHFCPKPPPQEIDFSPNAMCAYLDDSRFMSSSRHAYLRLWGLVE